MSERMAELERLVEARLNETTEQRVAREAALAEAQRLVTAKANRERQLTTRLAKVERHIEDYTSDLGHLVAVRDEVSARRAEVETILVDPKVSHLAERAARRELEELHDTLTEIEVGRRRWSSSQLCARLYARGVALKPGTSDPMDGRFGLARTQQLLKALAKERDTLRAALADAQQD